MVISGVRLPQEMIGITNLYDLLAAQHGSIDEREVRGVGIEGAVVDLDVLSLELPADIVELLGLTVERAGSRRLSPIRLQIRDRQATIQPFLTSGNRVVIGHVSLTALGLKYDPEWGLMDDTIPAP
jgi:hypothetical protein